MITAELRKLDGVYRLFKNSVVVDTKIFNQTPITNFFVEERDVFCHVIYPSSRMAGPIQWYVLFGEDYDDFTRIRLLDRPNDKLNYKMTDAAFSAKYGMNKEQHRSFYWAWRKVEKRKVIQAWL